MEVSFAEVIIIFAAYLSVLGLGTWLFIALLTAIRVHESNAYEQFIRKLGLELEEEEEAKRTHHGMWE